MTRTYTPTTIQEKAQAAHELLADVAQVLAANPHPKAMIGAKVLRNLLQDELREIVKITQEAGL